MQLLVMNIAKIIFNFFPVGYKAVNWLDINETLKSVILSNLIKRKTLWQCWYINQIIVKEEVKIFVEGTSKRCELSEPCEIYARQKIKFPFWLSSKDGFTKDFTIIEIIVYVKISKLDLIWRNAATNCELLLQLYPSLIICEQGVRSGATPESS